MRYRKCHECGSELKGFVEEAVGFCSSCVPRIEERRQTRPDRYVTKTGYVMVKVDGKTIPEHRVVMEQKLGRPLRRGESVHHINGHRDDNRPENLELWLAHPRYGVRARDLECPHCGEKYMNEQERTDSKLC